MVIKKNVQTQHVCVCFISMCALVTISPHFWVQLFRLAYLSDQ